MNLAALLSTVNRDGLIAAAILIGVILLGLGIERLLFAALIRFGRDHREGVLVALVRHAEAPARFAIPLLAALIVLPDLTFPPDLDMLLLRIVSILEIVAVAWGVIASVDLYTDLVKRHYRIDVADNLRARTVETRLDILSRATIVLVVLIGVAFAAMTFPAVRTVGATLLASAGVAGLFIGMASRPYFENLIAGVQIALTQPIRLDDVVIVQGEWGRIEHIGATYVVVRIWDQRRLVVPLSFFITTPFENWTRTGSALLGTVFLYVDYSVPLDEMRAELQRILGTTKLWDGAVQNVQMSDCKENVVEVRILVSARDSSDQWDLRCYVRENMIAWLREHYPRALPTQRQLSFTENGVATLAATR